MADGHSVDLGHHSHLDIDPLLVLVHYLSQQLLLAADEIKLKHIVDRVYLSATVCVLEKSFGAVS